VNCLFTATYALYIHTHSIFTIQEVISIRLYGLYVTWNKFMCRHS